MDVFIFSFLFSPHQQSIHKKNDQYPFCLHHLFSPHQQPIHQQNDQYPFYLHHLPYQIQTFFLQHLSYQNQKALSCICFCSFFPTSLEPEKGEILKIKLMVFILKKLNKIIMNFQTCIYTSFSDELLQVFITQIHSLLLHSH